MTCYLTCILIKKINYSESFKNSSKYNWNISKSQTCIIQLIKFKGDQILLLDLLYGLMLPSGDDAAIAIAEFFWKKFILRN